MKETKLRVSGLSDVYRFTLRQLFKTKANIVTLVIMMVLALASTPLMLAIFGGALDSGSTPTISVTVDNQTELDLSSLEGNHTQNALTITLAHDPAGADLHTVLTEEDGEFILIADGENSLISGAEAEAAAYTVSALVQECRLKSLGVTENMLVALNKNIHFETGSVSDFEDEDDDFLPAYSVQLSFSIIVMIVSIMSASYIIRSVIEEKVSKLVETMAISVDPLAMIFGKVLAILTFIIIELAGMLLCALLSYFVTGLFADTGAIQSVFQGGFLSVITNLSPLAVLVVIVSTLLGCLTFALISGLSGVGCATMEDAGSANSLNLLIVMACYMVSIFSTINGTPPTVFSIIPFLSVFCAPAQFLMGNVGIGAVILGWIVQAAVAALLALLAAKVYRDLLFYNGTRLKFGRIVSMAMKKEKEAVK